jgi:hypothetical protein
MKMGTTASPWRYDAARQATPQLARIAKATRASTMAAGANRDFGIASRARFEYYQHRKTEWPIDHDGASSHCARPRRARR